MKVKRLLFVLFLALLLIPTVALAANHEVISGTFNLSTCAAGDTVTVKSGATATLTGAVPTGVYVPVSCEAGVTLTISGVSIDNSISSDTCALSFTGVGNKLILSGSNTLKSGMNEPGIRAEDTTELLIYGSGSLDATGGRYAAGIGGADYKSGGKITISGGTVTARGDENGAGIGGGYGGAGGTIKISGGKVSAQGGNNAAGIGGGKNGAGGTIEITGGTVTAGGGHYGAGIGGGYDGAGGTITISGGTVYATGGYHGAGIGGGSGEGSGVSGGTIEIKGGTVTATGSTGGAGIGGGYMGGGGKITISDGTLDATGGENGAGIGGGDRYNGGTITLSGGTVTATGGKNAAGIGGGNENNSGGNITISGGTVDATGGTRGTGIGGGYNGSAGTIAISGGLAYAEGGTDSFVDIGDGYGIPDGTLTISNTAAVFLSRDQCLTPSLPDGHVHKTPTDAVNPMIFTNNEVYGITVSSSWTGAQGGYFRFSPYTIVYEANGGSGTPPDSPVNHIGTAVTVAGSGGLTKEGYVLSGWNTLASGIGTTYAVGTKLTLSSSITLYAVWTVPDTPQTGDDHAASLYLFAGLALASLLGMAAIIVDRRKRRAAR